MVYDVFRSKRLMYIPMENTTEHDDFLYRLRTSLTYANSGLALPTPGGTENSKKEIREYLIARARVAMYICLPPDSKAEASNTPSEAVVASKDSDAAKPTLIGILLLGKPGSDDLLWHHSKGAIGIQLLYECTGKGYGGEAIEWIMWYGFVVVGLHRMEIGTGGWNLGAYRLYQRLGFKPEGMSRKSLWYMGSWHDEYQLGMLQDEWREAQKEKGGNLFIGLDSVQTAKIMGCA